MRVLILLAAALSGCGGGDVFTGGIPSPTSQPIPGGNAAPQSVTLRNLVRTQDAVGDTRILGEAVTTSSTPLTFVKVTCTFKDSAGTTLGTDMTYVRSRVVKLVNTGDNTNSALSAGDTGYFSLLTSRSDATISSYSCVPSFSQTATTTPSARLEIQGEPTVTSDFRGDVMYIGSAKNTGSKPLMFGKVFAVTLSKTGTMLDMTFGYVTAQTPTDTRLDVEQIGTFNISQSVPFSERGTTVYLYDWSDDSLPRHAASISIYYRDSIARDDENIRMMEDMSLKMEWPDVH